MLVKDVWHPFSGEAAPDFSPVDDTLREGLPDIGLNGDSNVKIHPNPWYRQTFGDFTISEHPMYQRRALRIIATGAGCAGLQVAYKFQKHLQDLDLIIYEKNDSIGGTWFENRYPGCACDIPSVTYQFYWNRNPNWSSLYVSALSILIQIFAKGVKAYCVIFRCLKQLCPSSRDSQVSERYSRQV